MDKPIQIFGDITAANSWANSSESVKRAKHMDPKTIFVK